MAKSLVSHLTAPFKPNEFQDTYRENVERLIKQKQKGQKITTVEQPRKAPVIDPNGSAQTQPQRRPAGEIRAQSRRKEEAGRRKAA